MSDKATSEQFNLEYSAICLRIRKHMERIVPSVWVLAELLVREAEPESDQFLEIDTPLLNPDTDEIISRLPTEMLDALEELYLVFFPYHRPWETCIISLEPMRPYKRFFRTRFCYAENLCLPRKHTLLIANFRPARK